MTLPYSAPVTYAYNPDGQLTKLFAPTVGINGAQAAWGFDADAACVNRVKGASGTGAYFATVFTRDTLGTLTAMTNGTCTGTFPNPAPSTPVTLLTTTARYDSFQYTPEGLLQSLTATVNAAAPYTVTYAYTNRRQLQSETLAGSVAQTIAYSYDTTYASNLNQITRNSVSTSTLTFNDHDRLTNGGYAYDLNGNPTTYKGQTLTYDAANHLCGIPTTAGPVLTAGYYADGKRAWKQVGAGPKTYFLYDGDALVCELASTTGGYTTTATNLWGPDGLLARNTAGGTRWYEYDLQGNVIQRYQDSGALTPVGTNPASAPARYDAIGNLQDGTLDSTDPYGYNGQWGYYTDQETGLILCTHRYYDPTLGRWLTEDPIGYAGGMNLYGYCGGNGVGITDSNGQFLEIAIPALAGGIGGAWVGGMKYGWKGAIVGGIAGIAGGAVAGAVMNPLAGYAATIATEGWLAGLLGTGAGAVSGAAGGLTSGIISESGNALLNHTKFYWGNVGKTTMMSSAFSAGTGLIGGLMGMGGAPTDEATQLKVGVTTGVGKFIYNLSQLPTVKNAWKEWMGPSSTYADIYNNYDNNTHKGNMIFMMNAEN